MTMTPMTMWRFCVALLRPPGQILSKAVRFDKVSGLWYYW